ASSRCRLQSNLVQASSPFLDVTPHSNHFFPLASQPKRRTGMASKSSLAKMTPVMRDALQSRDVIRGSQLTLSRKSATVVDCHFWRVAEGSITKYWRR